MPPLHRAAIKTPQTDGAKNRNFRSSLRVVTTRNILNIFHLLECGLDSLLQ